MAEGGWGCQRYPRQEVRRPREEGYVSGVVVVLEEEEEEEERATMEDRVLDAAVFLSPSSPRFSHGIFAAQGSVRTRSSCPTPSHAPG